MNAETKRTLRALEEEKLRLARIRNARAEIYLIYLQRMEASADNPEMYEKFLMKLNDMEPYSQQVKAQATEINRQIAEITGQEVFEGGCIPTLTSI